MRHLLATIAAFAALAACQVETPGMLQSDTGASNATPAATKYAQNILGNLLTYSRVGRSLTFEPASGGWGKIAVKSVLKIHPNDVVQEVNLSSTGLWTDLANDAFIMDTVVTYDGVDLECELQTQGGGVVTDSCKWPQAHYCKHKADLAFRQTLFECDAADRTSLSEEDKKLVADKEAACAEVQRTFREGTPKVDSQPRVDACECGPQTLLSVLDKTQSLAVFKSNCEVAFRQAKGYVARSKQVCEALIKEGKATAAGETTCSCGTPSREVPYTYVESSFVEQCGVAGPAPELPGNDGTPAVTMDRRPFEKACAELLAENKDLAGKYIECHETEATCGHLSIMFDESFAPVANFKPSCLAKAQDQKKKDEAAASQAQQQTQQQQTQQQQTQQPQQQTQPQQTQTQGQPTQSGGTGSGQHTASGTGTGTVPPP